MIQATSNARKLWNSIPGSKRSRALAASRFIDLPFGEHKDNKNQSRRKACEAIAVGEVFNPAAQNWNSFLTALESSREGRFKKISATLKSRLLLNMAGSALENGGLSLDRNSGLPVIPGSAVKGLARKTAIHELSLLELSPPGTVLS